MNQPQENFDALQRLMRLKSKECPPPGVHDQLRQRIMANISLPAEPRQSSLWHQLLGWLESRPALASSYALAGIALLLCGAGFLKMVESESAEIRIGEHTIVAVPTHTTPPPQSFQSPPITVAQTPPQSLSSTNESIKNGPPPGLFDGAHLNSLPASDRIR